MTKGKLRIVCSECGFDDLDPAVVVTHMVETGHCLSPEIVEDLKVHPEFKQELVDGLMQVQTNPTACRPVSEEEMEEMELEHPEVGERMRAIDEREARRKQVN